MNKHLLLVTGFLSLFTLGAYPAITAQKSSTGNKSTVASLRALASVRKQLRAEDLFLHELLTEVRDELQHVIDDAEAETISIDDDKFEAITEAALTFNHALEYLEKAVQLFTARGSIATSALCSHFVSLCNAFTEFHPWNVEELDQKLRKFESVMMRHRPRGAQAVGSNSKELFDTLRMFSYHLRQCLSRPEHFNFALVDRFYNTCFVQPYRWVARNKGLTAVTTGFAAGLVYYFFIHESDFKIKHNFEFKRVNKCAVQKWLSTDCAAVSIVNAVVAQNVEAAVVPAEALNMAGHFAAVRHELLELLRNPLLSADERKELHVRLNAIPLAVRSINPATGRQSLERLMHNAPGDNRPEVPAEGQWYYIAHDKSGKQVLDAQGNVKKVVVPTEAIEVTAAWLSGGEVTKLLTEQLLVQRIADMLRLSPERVAISMKNVAVVGTQGQQFAAESSDESNSVVAFREQGVAQTLIVVGAHEAHGDELGSVDGGHDVVVYIEKDKGQLQAKIYDSMRPGYATPNNYVHRVLNWYGMSDQDFKADLAAVRATIA